MASLENRGGGSWRIIVCDGYDARGKKKRIQRTVNVDPKKTENAQRQEVKKMAALLEADYQRQKITGAKKITLQKVFSDYIQDRIIRRGLAPRTVDSYKNLFESRLLPEFGKKAIREITAQDLNQFFRKLETEGRIIRKKKGEKVKVEKKGLSGTYCRKFFQQMNELFKYAQRSGIIVTNPCTLIEPPRIDTQEASFYDLSECPAILDKIKQHPDPEWRCYFLLAFYCGTRPEELVGLDWADFDGSSISISAGAYQAKGEKCKRTDRPKTKKSNRKIALTADCINALKDWKAAQAAERLRLGRHWADPKAIFTNDLGERISMYRPSKAWRQFTNENEIRHLPLYDIRHTHCSLLISSRELSVEEVAARMGHAQTSTTLNIYSHAFQDANEKATAALENVLKNAE